MTRTVWVIGNNNVGGSSSGSASGSASGSSGGGAGPAGPQGLVGATGSQGPQGDAGDAGAVGPQGPIGPQGLVGDAGAVGPQGLVGDVGPQGPIGPQGLVGDAGAVGPQGPQGPQGLVGDAGAVGPQGPQGIQGTQLSPEGAVGAIQFKGPGSPGAIIEGSQYVAITGGSINLLPSPLPAPPSIGIIVFTRQISSRNIPSWVGVSGLDSSVQPFFAKAKIGLWNVNGSATTAASSVNLAVPTIAGTASTRSVTTTNKFTSMRRLGAASAATAGASAGWRLAVAQFFRNTEVEDYGGFHFMIRFGESTIVAESRSFVGMCSTVAVIGNVNPSTLTNIIGMGYDSGDTNWSLMHNDASGTATKVDLGVDFPSNTNNEAYELSIFCTSNSSNVSVEVTRLSTLVSVNTVLTTDLPASKQLLAFQMWVNNGITAASKAIDLVQAYIETEA